MISENNKLSAVQIILGIVYLIMIPVLTLFLSGDWLWVEGWIFGIWLIVISGITLTYLVQKDPELLRERFKQPGSDNQKEWDKYFIYALELLFLAWIVIMPLDAKRYEWTIDFPFWLKLLGGIELLMSFFFLYRSFTDNTFLSPMVRIQTERKHHVVSTGVYGLVRHPMYLGAIFLFIGTPLLLNSQYGLLIGVVTSLLLIARIFGEEKMLVEELDGYEDYKNRVKYRLIPLVW
ncbi:isoprenylcysteine carboxylmethyltransferase family protein [Phormidium sp. LEGE 05292]|uniref:methyltransferase family protein n=1 Tax=[Phormidium] sp. LEGE 05292 TaxID=767427 RepID=UPI0018807CAD|nr:isoprenylcysteine carboxylmethyltransferase family protein [Phormidium sp. LEGE 05292]MBE9226346.1 isoprenylcysteine carboxylmethyltransferase family protein [Phormidium sp. LEGE 05292]